jgi:hypothetical protein
LQAQTLEYKGFGREKAREMPRMVAADGVGKRQPNDKYPHNSLGLNGLGSNRKRV